jgi:hypothetical protein
MLTLPCIEYRGFLVRRADLPLSPRRYSRRGPLSPSVRRSEEKPVPRCPQVRSPSIQTRVEPSARRVWRFSQPRENFYADSRTCSCSARRRIASSSTSLWEIPSFCTNRRSNSCASELRRMLVCFFIPLLYTVLWYVSRVYHSPYAHPQTKEITFHPPFGKTGAFMRS